MLGFVTDVADVADIIVSIVCGIIVQLLLYFDIIVDNSIFVCLNYVIAVLLILSNDGCVV